MSRWWKDLSVAKKLYAVFGVMAFLILMELLTLSFAMNTLSAVRAFVEGEGLWSKGQKNAIQNLYQYAFTGDSKFYDEFHRNLRIPLGDRQARLEIIKPDPDMNVVHDGFVKGGVHPDDIPGIIRLLRRFGRVSYLRRAIDVWTRGDEQITELMKVGQELHDAIHRRRHAAVVRAAVIKVGEINAHLTELEVEFSHALGEGSRWLENLLLLTLILAVMTVECTGLFLTFTFSRTLSRSLKEIADAAADIGRGNFSGVIPVRSRDELGQLARSINKMILDLRTNIGQRMKAESASQTKSAFLANASHEIRTPLGVILGFTEILKDPNLSEADRIKYLDVIDQTGRNLGRIINDILDISKVEAGHLDVEVTRFKFPELMAEISAMLQLRAKEQNTQLIFENKGRVPDEIATDRVRLRQILLNLINNALKFTKDGKVTVTSALKGDLLSFEVADTGVGISESQKKALFQRFSQTDSAAQTHFEGTGLGLILSRGLARVLGGDVELKESQAGRGTIFTASIRLSAVDGPRRSSGAAAEATDADFVGLRGKKVLVVDDAPENQMIVKLFLGKHGMQIESAENGRVGFEKAKSADYDVVLMDMQMPEMDGYEATRRLRHEGYEKPIIALTAHAMKEDQRRCLEAGCSAFISKPIESGVLLRAIAKLSPPVVQTARG